jgi:hypothetical protein
MKLLAALMLGAALVLVPACGHAPTQSGLVIGIGTVVGRQAECSSWYLQADSGTLYETPNLPAEFREMNLRVRFTIRENHDTASACMRGAMADVIAMKQL